MLLVVLDALVEFDAFVALKFQTFSVRHLRPVPARLQRLGRGGAVVLLDRALPRAALRRGAPARRAPTTRASARAPGGRPPATTSGAGCCRCSPGSAVVVAVSVGIPVGMLDRLVHAEQPARALEARGEHPATSGRRRSPRSRSASARRSARARLRAPDRDARRALHGAGSRRCSSARPTCRSRCPTSSRRSRSPTRRATTRRRSTAASSLLVLAEAMLFVPVRGRRAARDARTDRARARGLGALARLGAAARRLRRVTMPLARPGLVAAGVLVFAFVARRPLDRAGAAAAQPATRSAPSSRPTARRSRSRRPRPSPPC